MSNNSTRKTLTVALGVCLVCSIMVSAAAVSLSKIQKENKRRDKFKNILQAGDLYTDSTKVEETFRRAIQPQMIDLETGEVVDPVFSDKLNVETFDIRAIAMDPELGVAVAQNKDLGQIKRKPRYMAVYPVVQNGEMVKIILPIYGKGLWSTMYGFLALNRDLRTIDGFTFYEHGETPGLGGEVDNPKWKSLWRGKAAFDDQGQVVIQVIKGQTDPGDPSAGHQIDGLSGATITTRGVDQLVKFWLGDQGYGPFLNKLREAKRDAQS
ncbi:MAG TPA: Na(+)-translocating NADH-quinone reductase subunit C [bacterium]|nr:Na(+)-translocating NADH-quinone reductase subunit C [bacterium]HOX84982.1 Na(+)-translocating NADH-quinone reductase subunit C [bacterium]HPG44152.1 Na(+)-translocating NADH-quinone reductase subunit C [bacterium]HPM96519.1 Na(+)-translocating NADH-quinone reductase subunit C [bacterium]